MILGAAAYLAEPGVSEGLETQNTEFYQEELF